VDDDSGVRADLQEDLESRGVNVWTASTADDALELLQQHQPAAILVGLFLPHLEILAFHDAIHRAPQYNGTYVIVMAPSQLDAVQWMELEDRASRVVDKHNVNAGQLLEWIERALQPPTAEFAARRAHADVRR